MDKLKLNIILDSRRIEKYHPLMDELERQKIDNFELWPCLMFPSVVRSINLSHKMIVEDAKERGLQEVCIAEDDLWFPAEDGWEYFLSKKPAPQNYDLYLAATYIPPISNNMICGFHLYFVSSKFYDRFLSVPDEKHIDTSMDELKGNYIFCYPFAALQRAGFSSNNMTDVNYNSILKEEDVYGKFR